MFPFFIASADSFWLGAVISAGVLVIVSCKSMKVRLVSTATEDFRSRVDTFLFLFFNEVEDAAPLSHAEGAVSRTEGFMTAYGVTLPKDFCL